MPDLTDLRYRAEYSVFYLIAALFSAMPVDWASAVSGWGWRHIAPFTKRHGRAVRQLARSFPEKSPRECDAIAREMWESLGRTFGEFFHLEDIYYDGRITLENAEVWRNAGKDGRGFVACAPHQANWEVAVMGLPRAAVKTAGLYQRIKNPYVDAHVKRIREPFYPGGLVEKSGASALRLLRHVQKNGSLATMADLRDARGVKVPFFGFPAPSTPFPAVLARSLDVPLYACRIVRDRGARFRVRLVEIEVPRTSDKNADIQCGAERLNASFEASIRERPGQWMWAHRRWG